MVVLGWKSVGVLEPTALPTIPRHGWEGWVRDADVLLVNGGGVSNSLVGLFGAEHWIVADNLGLLQQLGAIPAPG